VSTPPNEPGSSSGRGVEHLNVVRAVLVVAAFVVVAALLLAKGTSTEISSGSSSVPVTTTTRAPVTTTTIPRSQIKVQVANASSTSGAATKVTQQLQTAGWDTLPPVNATAKVPTSVVYYAANRKPAALEIAVELHLAASAVQPLTASVPVPGAAGDDVVVLIGPDLAG